MADAIGEKFDESAQQQSSERFREECAKLSETAELKDERISLRCLALIIGIHRYYDSHYRMYCRFTHASLRALIGNLDDVATDEDSVTMVLCLFSAIKSIVAIGGAAPNFDALHNRRDALLKEKMEKDGRHGGHGG